MKYYQCLFADDLYELDNQFTKSECMGGVIGSNWLCKKCHDKYVKGLEYKDYPEWIKELIKIERRNRLIEESKGNKEISLDKFLEMEII